MAGVRGAWLSFDYSDLCLILFLFLGNDSVVDTFLLNKMKN